MEGGGQARERQTHPNRLLDQVGQVTLQLNLELILPVLRLPPCLFNPLPIDAFLLPLHLHLLHPRPRKRILLLPRLKSRNDLAIGVVGVFVELDVESELLD
jgi:hypothetical protein